MQVGIREEKTTFTLPNAALLQFLNEIYVSSLSPSSPSHNQSVLGFDSEFNLLKVNLPSYLSLLLSCLVLSHPGFSLSHFPVSRPLCYSLGPPSHSVGDKMLNLFTPLVLLLWNSINDLIMREHLTNVLVVVI